LTNIREKYLTDGKNLSGLDEEPSKYVTLEMDKKAADSKEVKQRNEAMQKEMLAFEAEFLQSPSGRLVQLGNQSETPTSALTGSAESVNIKEENIPVSASRIDRKKRLPGWYGQEIDPMLIDLIKEEDDAEMQQLKKKKLETEIIIDSLHKREMHKLDRDFRQQEVEHRKDAHRSYA
jgi:hypothetical protein